MPIFEYEAFAAKYQKSFLIARFMKWNGFYYIFKIDRINRIIRINFCLHQFLEEIDEIQSTFGGEKNFRVSNIL